MVEGQGRNQTDAPSDGATKLPVIRPPRAWAWGFVLHCVTLGLYTCFWLVGLLREMQRLNQPKVRPWLWFFVPLVALVQFIALPRLVDYLRDAEEQRGLSPWGASRYVWIVSVILLSLFFILQHRIATPMWTVLPTLLLWGALFSVIEVRFNRVRQSVQDDLTEVADVRQPYRWWEWVLLVPFVPFTLLFIPYVSLDSLGVYDLRPLPEGSIYKDDVAGFQFPVLSSGWREVAAGTHSDDEAVLELSGPIDGAFAIVYRYDNQTVSELAYDRKSSFYRSVRSSNCTELRRFTEKSLNIASHLICEGREYNMGTLQATGIIQGQDGVYELMVYMNTPPITYRELKPELVRMTREFAPL